MNRNSIGIAVVFIVFVIPILLLSVRNGSITTQSDVGDVPVRSDLDVSEAVQVHYFEGRIYILKAGGELLCDNQPFMQLPEDTVDFCLYKSEVYVLRPDGLYVETEKIWDHSLAAAVIPSDLLILPSEQPRAYVLLSDGSYRQRMLE